jgi:tellurite resistance protein TerC
MPSNVALFPFSQYWWFYSVFTVFILMLLAVDLGVFHRKAHAVSVREAAGWSVLWVALALAFNAVVYRIMTHWLAIDPRFAGLPGFDPEKLAYRSALEFLAGYITEYSLSVDNIFVFVVVMNYFCVPSYLQHRVLFFGILGALIFRGVFIALGSALMHLKYVVLAFGVFLLFTGFKIMFSEDKGVEPERNVFIRIFRRVIPVTAKLQGQSFFVVRKRRLHATPLFVALLFLEMTDIVFAVDSVPAIFGLTREPLIVFTSNVFAILGLRSMYFMLAGAMDKFHLLKYGLGVVLIFVGLKMVWLNDLYHGHFPIDVSLGIIVGVIGIAIALSLIFPATPKETD